MKSGKHLKIVLLLMLIGFYATTVHAQVTIAFNFGVDGGNQGLNGNIRICNNSGATLPNNYTISFRWPAFQGFGWGPTAVRNGTGSCDTWTFTFESWQLPADGACKDISAGANSGGYTPPLAYPAYGIDQFGDTVKATTTGTFIPKSYNQVNWQYSFDANCFIKSPTTLLLGEAQIREWNNLADVRVPQNRKSWALTSAHVATLFNNMVGADVVSINYVFAQSMIEGRMGCDPAFTPPGGDNNPLTYQAGAASSGCFQILPPGWAQIQQYYPTLTAPLTYSNIIAGDNFVTAGLSKALFDMTTFVKYEKISCANPIGFFINSADPYAAEEILAFAYHEGIYGSEPALNVIFKTNRAALLTETNIARYLATNYTNSSNQYAERMRNNLIQLENNFGVAGSFSRLTSEAQTNWVGTVAPPTGYEWHGYYNGSYTWTDISNYIDEAAVLFWTANVPLVKTNVQAVFNSINGGAAVNFQQLGPVIDAIVLNFPVYSPDEGLGELFFASACGSPSVSMSTCDKICSGQKGELWVHLMGTAPFSYTIQGPTGTLYTRTNVNLATDMLKVTEPGTYKVINIQDANGQVFLNCHQASAVIQQANGCSLPVSLLNFNAKAGDEFNVLLNWSTAMEKDNDHFLIERSHDGITFEVIGQVEGAGNSSTLIHYDFIDYTPYHGKNYYRLRQVDYDGTESLSGVESVNFVSGVQVMAAPNPNGGTFNIVMNNTDKDSASEVLLYNVLGHEYFRYSGLDKTITVEGLPTGVYILQVKGTSYTHTEKVIVE